MLLLLLLLLLDMSQRGGRRVLLGNYRYRRIAGSSHAGRGVSLIRVHCR